jgi:hypothetical protein
MDATITPTSKSSHKRKRVKTEDAQLPTPHLPVRSLTVDTPLQKETIALNETPPAPSTPPSGEQDNNTRRLFPDASSPPDPPSAVSFSIRNVLSSGPKIVFGYEQAPTERVQVHDLFTPLKNSSVPVPSAPIAPTALDYVSFLKT